MTGRKPGVMEDEMADRSRLMRIRLHDTLLHVASSLPESPDVAAARLSIDDEDFPLAVMQLSSAVNRSGELNEESLAELRAVGRELELWGVVAVLTP
jgi:hypothetical protein